MISDGNRGLKQALARLWPGVAHQRCVVHKQRNVVSAAPRHVQGAVRHDFQAIVYAESLAAAQAARTRFVATWRKRAPRAVARAPGYAKDPPGVCRTGLCVCEAADYER